MPEMLFYLNLVFMKVIAVGRNYIEHARELKNPVPTKPVIFLKPDTAVLKNNRDFYYPEFTKNIHHEVEVVVQICKEGKHVEEKFAKNYYDKVGLGIDFTARDIQQEHKEKGLPWELAKAFDHSAPISYLFPKEKYESIHKLPFFLEINGIKVQEGNTADMIFSIEKLISFISKYITLRKGDLLFTGTPAGVGPITIGDHIVGYLDKEAVLDFHVK
jgi:2-keto-4-pentenoate hydratase/2-oxohepta-3-ene-1,7-dioic acid hydratase in catechol pathway